MASHTRTQYRDAETGLFIKGAKAKQMPKSQVIKETVPDPGYGAKEAREQYRDADSGRFLTERQAARRSSATVVKERVPNPGHGTAY